MSDDSGWIYRLTADLVPEGLKIDIEQESAHIGTVENLRHGVSTRIYRLLATRNDGVVLVEICSDNTHNAFSYKYFRNRQ